MGAETKPDFDPEELIARWQSGSPEEGAPDPGVSRRPSERYSQLAAFLAAEAGAAFEGDATIPVAGFAAAASELAGDQTRPDSNSEASAPVEARLETTAPLPNAPSRRPASEKPPFDKLRPLARGGMGMVYRARQVSLDRDVAVKTVAEELDAEEDRRRFIAEALVTGMLDHPNIVPVYDLLNGAGSELMMAMKLVEGQSWSARVRPAPEKGAKAPAEASEALSDSIEVLIKVCDAVSFAHARGVGHLDLKPENVMVGRFGEVLVMDWGLAVDLREPAARAEKPYPVLAAAEVREAGGTPFYMAPEQVLPEVHGLSARTDVWLLGAILYELLTGHPPNRAQTLAEVLAKAANAVHDPLPPSAPAELAATCERCLRWNPAERIESVEALQAELRSWQRHRESSLISTHARALLSRCEDQAAPEGLDPAVRSQLYADFAEALAGFKQAQLLWQGNAAAADGERAARLSFARAALANGDLGLAEAQLAFLGSADPEATALRSDLAARREQARAAAASARRTRSALLGATAVIILGLALGLAVTSWQKQQIDEARRVAETERQKVARQRDEIATQRDEIAASRAEVASQRDLAESRLDAALRASRTLVKRVDEDLSNLPGKAARRARKAMLRDALAILREVGDADRSPELRAEIALKSGELARLNGDDSGARAAFERGLEHLARAEDTELGDSARKVEASLCESLAQLASGGDVSQEDLRLNEDLLGRAQRIRADLVDQDPSYENVRDLTSSLLDYVDVLMRLERRGSVVETFKRIDALRRLLPEEQQITTEMTRLRAREEGLGVTHHVINQEFESARLANAQRLLRFDTLRRRGEATLTDELGRAQCVLNRANLLFLDQKSEEACAFVDDALSSLSLVRRLDPDSPAVLAAESECYEVLTQVVGDVRGPQAVIMAYRNWVSVLKAWKAVDPDSERLALFYLPTQIELAAKLNLARLPRQAQALLTELLTGDMAADAGSASYLALKAQVYREEAECARLLKQRDRIEESSRAALALVLQASLKEPLSKTWFDLMLMIIDDRIGDLEPGGEADRAWVLRAWKALHDAFMSFAHDARSSQMQRFLEAAFERTAATQSLEVQRAFIREIRDLYTPLIAADPERLDWIFFRSKAFTSEANVLVQQSKIAEAATAQGEAVTICDELAKQELPPEFLRALAVPHFGQVQLLQRLERYDEAREVNRRRINLLSRSLRDSGPLSEVIREIAADLQTEAELYSESGDLKLCAGALTESVSLRRQVHAAMQTPTTAIELALSLSQRGHIAGHLEDFEGAQESLREALRILAPLEADNEEARTDAENARARLVEIEAAMGKHGGRDRPAPEEEKGE